MDCLALVRSPKNSPLFCRRDARHVHTSACWLALSVILNAHDFLLIWALYLCTQKNFQLVYLTHLTVLLYCMPPVLLHLIPLPCNVYTLVQTSDYLEDRDLVAALVNQAGSVLRSLCDRSDDSQHKVQQVRTMGGLNGALG